MSESYYNLQKEPVYNTEIPAITVNTPAHAETVLRPLFETIINNTEYVRQEAESAHKAIEALSEENPVRNINGESPDDEGRIAINTGVMSFNSQAPDSSGNINYTAPVMSVNNKTGAIALTKSDVDLGNVENVLQYSISNPPPYPVTSVNGQTGAVVIDTPEATTSLGYIGEGALGFNESGSSVNLNEGFCFSTVCFEGYEYLVSFSTPLGRDFGMVGPAWNCTWNAAHKEGTPLYFTLNWKGAYMFPTQTRTINGQATFPLPCTLVDDMSSTFATFTASCTVFWDNNMSGFTANCVFGAPFTLVANRTYQIIAGGVSAHKAT